MWVLPGKFGSGSSSVGMFPGVREQQQALFGHNVLLGGALEVNGAASDFCSGIPSGGGPRPTSGIRDNCGGLPLLPADHARSTLSHLAHIGGAAPAASSCGVLGRDSDQVFGCRPEHLAVAAAAQVCSQGSENNSIWCLVAVPSFCLFFQPLR